LITTERLTVSSARALAGARMRSTMTSAGYSYSIGSTSIGMPAARAASAAASRLPSVSFPSLARTIRFAASSGATATARRTPAARSVASVSPTNVRSTPSTRSLGSDWT